MGLVRLSASTIAELGISGFDRTAGHWKQGYAIEGVEGLDPHHLYRAMAQLSEPLPKEQQDEVPSAGKKNGGAGEPPSKKGKRDGTPPAIRCTKDRIEVSSQNR